MSIIEIKVTLEYTEPAVTRTLQVPADNRQPPEQVRVNLVLGVFLACVWRPINRNQSHKPHQTAHTMATTFVTMSLHVSRHLPRSIPWCFKKLLVDQFHEPQVLSTLAFWGVIQI